MTIGREYWLVPGMETIPSASNSAVVVGGTAGTGLVETQLPNYQLGSTITWNTPRSMAIGYNKIDINGAAIHLTEIRKQRSPIGTETYHAIKGWSQDVSINIYGFCKINQAGIPDIIDPGFVITPISIGRGLQVLSGASAGLCTCETFTPKTIGCNVGHDESVFLGVTVKVGTLPPPPALTSWSIFSRTISVTIHGEQTDQSGMILS